MGEVIGDKGEVPGGRGGETRGIRCKKREEGEIRQHSFHVAEGSSG